jgi:hypothetical protein
VLELDHQRDTVYILRRAAVAATWQGGAVEIDRGGEIPGASPTVAAPRARPGDKLVGWRSRHWPPVGMRQIAGLPIYVGTVDQVERFVEPLTEALLVVADHIYDHCGGKAPRWMRVPKICSGVTRLNLVTAKAKSSRRFEDISELLQVCGEVSEDDARALREWLASDDDAELVAHKPFVDLRAYVFDADAEDPRRFRFYESGLVLAAADGFVIQDQRGIVRKQRSDVLREPLARTAKGWDVFARRAERRNAHADTVASPPSTFSRSGGAIASQIAT